MALQIIKQPYTISFAGNPVAFTFAITPYRAPELKKDYKIVVAVQIEDAYLSNTFTTAKELLLYPEENGCATICIEKILKSFLDQLIPGLDQNTLVPVPEQCKRYQVNYKLLNGNTVVADTLATSATYYILKGGISYGEWDAKKFFTQKLANDKTFLRFPATKEYVFTDEYKFLSWISSADITQLQNVYVRIGYNDGTIGDPLLLNSINLNLWQPCIMPAGYNQLQLDTIGATGKIIVWYEISVQSDRAIAWRVQASTAYCVQDSGSNTGYQSWTTLEQYYIDDDSAVSPAVTKANTNSDADYVAPIVNTTACPLTITRTVAWRAKASTAYCLQDSYSHNTGSQAWTTLEQYYTDDNTPVLPASTKTNVDTDADYVAPVNNTTACPLGAHFVATTFVSGDALNDNETANFNGLPGATVTIKLTTLNNSNGGQLKVNGSNAYLNNTWNVTLDGSGNGSLDVSIAGVTHPSSAILGTFTITASTSGAIGSNNTYTISKVF